LKQKAAILRTNNGYPVQTTGVREHGMPIKGESRKMGDPKVSLSTEPGIGYPV